MPQADVGFGWLRQKHAAIFSMHFVRHVAEPESGDHLGRRDRRRVCSLRNHQRVIATAVHKTNAPHRDGGRSMFLKSFPNHYGKDDEREGTEGCASGIEGGRQSSPNRVANAGSRFLLALLMFHQGDACREDGWEGEEESANHSPNL